MVEVYIWRRQRSCCVGRLHNSNAGWPQAARWPDEFEETLAKCQCIQNANCMPWLGALVGLKCAKRPAESQNQHWKRESVCGVLGPYMCHPHRVPQPCALSRTAHHVSILGCLLSAMPLQRVLAKSAHQIADAAFRPNICWGGSLDLSLVLFGVLAVKQLVRRCSGTRMAKGLEMHHHSVHFITHQSFAFY